MGLAKLFRQEGRKKGEQEDRKNEGIALVSRLLHRKIGLYWQLDQIVLQLHGLSIESLKDLADEHTIGF